ncbi:hypothetical protein GCM10009527_002860 [Actinomadura nitritigenes]
MPLQAEPDVLGRGRVPARLPLSVIVFSPSVPGLWFPLGRHLEVSPPSGAGSKGWPRTGFRPAGERVAWEGKDWRGRCGARA